MVSDAAEGRQTEEELLLLLKITHMLNRGVTQEEVFKTIVEGLRSLYSYDSVAIHLLGKDHKHLIIKRYSADSRVVRKLEKLTGSIVKGYKVPLYEGSIHKRIIDTKNPVITDDVTWVLKSYAGKTSLQTLAKAAAKLTKAKWGMGVPLLAGDKVLGVIGCGSDAELTDKDAQRLAVFGAQAGMAIEKQRRYDLLEDMVKERTAELKTRNEELQKSEATSRALLNAIPDLIFLINRDGVFLEYKLAEGTEHYLSPDKVIGKN